MLLFDEIFGKHVNSEEIKNALRECDSIKYAAYRTAAKLRIIQKALLMDKITLKVISCVFERHKLRQTENSVQLDQREIESVLSDIYFVLQKENYENLNIDYVSQLFISFLLNAYDKKMSNIIQVLSFKVCLILLCQGKPREKYHYLFNQLADHNKCLSRKKLQMLLKKIITITEFIGEGLSFGSDLIAGTVESCFKCNVGTLGISEDVFIAWLMQDPQLLVWVSTMHRFQISEFVTHNAKCSKCKIYPIIGLRYHCLRCLSYDMCQSCFFTGKVTRNHKLKHSVQEYCCPMTSQQSTKAFLLTLRNRLYKKHSKLQYLPALRVDLSEAEALGQSTKLLDEIEISSRTLINGSRLTLRKFPDRELQSIILHLETESKRLIPQIDKLCLSVGNSEVSECQSQLKNCLVRHKTQVEAQVQRLKLLKKYLMTSGKFSAKAVLASTPVADGGLIKCRDRDLETLSPISRLASCTREEVTFDKKMEWDNYDLVNHGIEETWKGMPKTVLERIEGCPGTEPNNAEGSDLYLSTWLGGRSFLAVDSSSKRGFTWLKETTTEKNLREENEAFQELQSDLKQILNKIHELSSSCGSKQESTQSDDILSKEEEMQTAIEVDTLLVDLINGIEKLIGT